MARTNDPATSHAAASHVNLHGSQEYVLELFDRYGAMTDPHLIDHARRDGSMYSESRLRTARKECLDRGWVRDTQVTLPTRFGREATVWQITTDGLEALYGRDAA